MPTTFEQTTRTVQIKSVWSDPGDPWATVTYLWPIQVSEVAAPEIAQARLRYDFGAIQREGLSTYTSYSPQDLLNKYVRVLTQKSGGEQEVQFAGIITDVTTTHDRPSSESGAQDIFALGMVHLLDSITVTTAYALSRSGPWEGPSGAEYQNQTAVHKIDWAPRFNERNTRTRSLSGNRSPGVDGRSPMPGISFVFAAPAIGKNEETGQWAEDIEVWNAFDAIDYLLANFGPSISGVGPRFELSGDIEVLSNLKQEWNYSGMTLWTILNRLIDRRRGIGFTPVIGEKPKYPGEENPEVVIRLEVFTVVKDPVTIGDTTLPGNSKLTTLTIPTTYPDSHQLGVIPVTTSASSAYDVIWIRGERALSIGTFSYRDGTLEKGWTDELEDEYKKAVGGYPLLDIMKKNDALRGETKYDAVYAHHVVPINWEFKVSDGTGFAGRPFYVMDPFFWEWGNYDPDDLTHGGYWDNGKRFLRELPGMAKGRNYDWPDWHKNHDTNPGRYKDQEWQLALVFIADFDESAWHSPDEIYHNLRTMVESGIQGVMRSVNIRPLDNRLGFEVRGTPKHYLGNNHFDHNNIDTTGPTQYPEVLDYRELVITAALRTDVRQKIRLQMTPAATPSPSGVFPDGLRELTIDVPGAEFWRIDQKAVIGLKDEQKPGKGWRSYNMERVWKTHRVLRDDVLLLEAVAAFASAWYGVDRQTIRIPIAGLEKHVELGSLLTSINNLPSTVLVNTVVTGRTLNFMAYDGHGETTISTGWGSLGIVQPSIFGAA